MKKFRKKLRRGLVVLLGVVMLAGQMQMSVYAESDKDSNIVTDTTTVSGNTLEKEVSGDDTDAVSEEVKKVQALIDALPAVDEVKAMNEADRNIVSSSGCRLYAH